MEYHAEFSKFLESSEYDEAEEALYNVISSAFKAGWLAANGLMPETVPSRVIKILSNKRNRDFIES